jgi:hypothetical protein
VGRSLAPRTGLVLALAATLGCASQLQQQLETSAAKALISPGQARQIGSSSRRI